MHIAYIKRGNQTKHIFWTVILRVQGLHIQSTSRKQLWKVL